MYSLLLNRKLFFIIFFLWLIFVGGLVALNLNQLSDYQYIISLSILSLSVLFVLIFYNKSSLLRDNYIATFFYLFFTFISLSKIPSIQFSIALLCTNLVVISFSNYQIKYLYFNIGFLMVIANFLVPMTLFYSICCIFIILLNSSKFWLSLLQFIIGFCTPIVLGFEILFLLDNIEIFDSYLHNLYFSWFVYQPKILFFAPLLITFFLALVDHLMSKNKQSMEKRKKINLLIISIFAWFVCFYCFIGDDYSFLIFGYVPIIILISRLLQYWSPSKKMFAEIMVWILIIAGILYRIYYLL